MEGRNSFQRVPLSHTDYYMIVSDWNNFVELIGLMGIFWIDVWEWSVKEIWKLIENDWD